MGLLGANSVCAATGRTVVDSVGRAVEVPTSLQRIISLAPSVTEILFALEVDEQLVAVTDFCDYQPAATRKLKVGGMYHPNLEQIIGLRPDVVITAVGASQKDTVLRLEKLGVPVYVLNPKSMDDILASILRVAELVSREREAQRFVGDLRHRLFAIERRLSGQRPVRALYLLWYQPLMTVGPGSFLHEIMTLAGGDNLAKDAVLSYPTYSLEQVLTAAPEVIVLNSDSAPFLHLIAEQPQRWSHLPAVRNGRIHVVETGLMNRPSPRSVDAVELLARFLHPKVFAHEPLERR
jgi:iron complex transport system substrate-binding protein